LAAYKKALEKFMDNIPYVYLLQPLYDGIKDELFIEIPMKNVYKI
jgi:hypothetical protein